MLLGWNFLRSVSSEFTCRSCVPQVVKVALGSVRVTQVLLVLKIYGGYRDQLRLGTLQQG